MTPSSALATLTIDGDLTITRMGYGAMQLAGPGVFGPPADRAEAIAVLRAAADAGVTHIDTADFYGPVVVNELIREALHPYADLTIATKVGVRRGDDGSWNHSTDPADLQAQVRDNLDHLGVERLDLVYLSLPAHDGITDDSLEVRFAALAEMADQGVISHLGLSGASDVQLSAAQAIAPVAAVQNLYNLIARDDDPLVDRAVAERVAYVSFFPLGGFAPIQSETLAAVAGEVGATPQQVALAWLLQRSATSVVIPGTSTRAHLRENVAAAGLRLPAEITARLDTIAASAGDR